MVTSLICFTTWLETNLIKKPKSPSTEDNHTILGHLYYLYVNKYMYMSSQKCFTSRYMYVTSLKCFTTWFETNLIKKKSQSLHLTEDNHTILGHLYYLYVNKYMYMSSQKCFTSRYMYVTSLKCFTTWFETNLIKKPKSPSY